MRALGACAAWLMLLVTTFAFGADANAPSAPYRWIGRVVHHDEQQALFMRGERFVAAKHGDILDGVYLVETIGRDEVVLRHVRSGERSYLHMRGASVARATPARPASHTASTILQDPSGSGAADPRRGPIPKPLE